MRYAYFGGAFNPPHYGHKEVVNIARSYADRIILTPSSAFRWDKNITVSNEKRELMLKLFALECGNDVEIDLSELRREVFLGTYEYLKMEQEKRPDDEILFFIGQDAAADILSWRDEKGERNGHKILEEFKVYVVPRANSPELPQEILEKVSITDSPAEKYAVLSSSRIRETGSGDCPASVKVLWDGMFDRPGISTDIIVRVGDKVLLIKRKHPPYEGYWALPGGYFDCTKDKTLRDCFYRELEEETGITKEYVNRNATDLNGMKISPLVMWERENDVDPRGVVMTSVSTINFLEFPAIKVGDDAEDYCWRYFDEIYDQDLAFDHALIIKENWCRS